LNQFQLLSFRFTGFISVFLWVMKIKLTTDKNHRSASYGIENGTPWIEYTDGKRDRVALYGHTESLRKRIGNEITARGLILHSEAKSFLNLIPNLA